MLTRVAIDWTIGSVYWYTTSQSSTRTLWNRSIVSSPALRLHIRLEFHGSRYRYFTMHSARMLIINYTLLHYLLSFKVLSLLSSHRLEHVKVEIEQGSHVQLPLVGARSSQIASLPSNTQNMSVLYAKQYPPLPAVVVDDEGRWAAFMST